MKNKKAQSNLDKLMTSILLLIIIGFTAAGGVIGLDAFGSDPSIVDSFSVNEENATIAATGKMNLDFSSFPYRLTGVSRIVNSTGDAPVLTTSLFNVTTGDGGFVTMSPNLTTNTDAWNVSYSYTANTVASNISRNSEIGILNITSLFGVIGVLLGVGALLVVVLSFAPGTRLGRG